MNTEQKIAELEKQVAEMAVHIAALRASQPAVVVIPVQMPVQTVPAYQPYREWNWKPYVTCSTN